MSYKAEFIDLEKKLYSDAGSNIIADEYIAKRFEQSTKWYIKMAYKFKNIYFAFSTAGIILPAIVTVINNIEGEIDFNIKFIITILSVLTTVITSLLTLTKVHEKWINCRSTAEMLQRELTFFKTKTDKYQTLKDEECVNVFGNSIEQIMAQEHLRWVEVVNSKESKSAN